MGAEMRDGPHVKSETRWVLAPTMTVRMVEGSLTMGAPYLELRFCLYVFGKVGCDGLIKLVEDAHGEHRVDMTRLDEFVQRICKLHPDPTMPGIRNKIQCRRIRSALRVRCCSLLVALYEWRVATYEERR